MKYAVACIKISDTLLMLFQQCENNSQNYKSPMTIEDMSRYQTHSSLPPIYLSRIQTAFGITAIRQNETISV